MEKQQFSSRGMFILAAIGSAVGLGNIWRYPFVAFDNGGGAFLIPYFIALITAAFPILLLEFLIGNKFRGSAPLSWARIKSKWEFLGWLPSVVAGMIIYYYIIVLTWAANYIPFAWNMSWEREDILASAALTYNAAGVQGIAPTQYFFGYYFLNQPPLEDIGGNQLRNVFAFGSFNWGVIIALLVMWVATYIVCSKNIKSGLEKINKILLPILFLSVVALLIYGLSLPGGTMGLNALFTPDFSALSDPAIWIAAYGQVFFSVSACMAIMITYSAYLPKKTELVNTSLTIAFADSLMSMIAATAIFGILGFMAYTQGVGVADVAAGGPGLVFVTLPAAFSEMGEAGRWLGTAFFVSLLMIGWTSLISLVEAFIAPFIDKYNVSRKKAYAVVSISGFFLSLIYATDVGLLLVGIVGYVLDYGLLITALLQALAVAWFIKNKKGQYVIEDLKAFANESAYVKLGSWYNFLVKFALPFISLAILLFTAFQLVTGNTAHTNQPTSVLIVFYGGTAFITVAAVIYFTKAKWRDAAIIDKQEE